MWINSTCATLAEAALDGLIQEENFLAGRAPEFADLRGETYAIMKPSWLATDIRKSQLSNTRSWGMLMKQFVKSSDIIDHVKR